MSHTKWKKNRVIRSIIWSFHPFKVMIPWMEKMDSSILSWHVELCWIQSFPFHPFRQPFDCRLLIVCIFHFLSMHFIFISLHSKWFHFEIMERSLLLPIHFQILNISFHSQFLFFKHFSPSVSFILFFRQWMKKINVSN